jgi:Na+/H+-translocating membrane pyrophosphatase
MSYITEAQKKHIYRTVRRHTRYWLRHLQIIIIIIIIIIIYLFIYFTGATTHSGFVFCSPLAGYSLLAYEVSWSHTTTQHSR